MTILVAVTIIATLVVSALFAQLVSSTATTYNTDNITVNGVLASDSYVLYPYEAQNLMFGFSKYGELINGVAKQGLEYYGMDVFANPNVLEKDWSQGWLIDIHYADISNRYKRAWAFALYADQSGTGGIGGDWKENCTGNPDTSIEQGGRRTSVWATTDPIKVLYDGPRRFVALTKTTIYDGSTKTVDNALVSVTITLEFNKDKKEVILFKDVKRLDEGKFGRTFQVEFSNRGEWDIGDTSAPPSYAHFYHNLPTAYDYEYHAFYSLAHPITGYDMCQMIDQAGTYAGFVAYWPQVFGKLVDGTTHVTREVILNSICTVTKNETWLTLGSPDDKEIDFADLGWLPSDPYPIGGGEFSDEPMVYKNNILLTEGVEYHWTAGHITFVSEPANTDVITVVYKHSVNPGEDDMITHAGSEPDTPYVIGEWCFDLRNEPLKKQFRGVTVYGLTDRHDADDNDASDEDWSSGANVIDSEVQYLLNETFNPFDLYSAVEKQEYRWVDIRDLVTATSYITLTNGLNDKIYQPNGYSETTHLPITASQTWTGYNYTTLSGSTFAWLNEYEDGIDAHSKNWVAHLNSTMSNGDETMLKITPTGFGVNVTGALTFGNITDFGFWYYMGPNSHYGPHIEFELYNSTGRGYVVLGADRNAPSPSLATGTWIHYTLNDILSFVTPGPAAAETPFFVRYNPMAYTKDDLGALIETYEGASYMHSWEWFQERFGSFYVGSVGISARHDYDGVDCYVDDLSVAYLHGASGIRYERVYNMEEDKLIPSDWNAYCTFAERVLVDGVLIDRDDSYALRYYVEGVHVPYYTIDFVTGNITFSHYATGTGYHAWTLPIGTHIKVLYSTIEMNEKGRYEWMVLGKNARTIDSAAAAYVSEAFDSTKDIRVEMMGMDIREFDYGPNSPYVMAGATTGVRTDYNDSLGRPGLKDDWCTTWPVASSNMIFMAGPRANLGTEYMNEFLNVFFARSEYVVNNTGQSNTIMGLSCWNRNNYTSGYGVISVYKDLNGTIGLVFWGYTADDYYYTCKWFWSYPAGITCPDLAVVYSGIEYLQHQNRGVTDIILKITYPTADPTHPTVAVTTERLGTISEKTQHDP
jgi:hypothetical protein